MSEAFSGRVIEPIVVEHVGNGGLSTTDGWGWGLDLSTPWASRLIPGAHLEVERRGSRITGLRFPGEEWLYHDSDEDLSRRDQELRAAFRARNEEALEENREDWARREALLPRDLQERLAFFRERGGLEFEVEGWGYELIVCELAALYREAGFDDGGRLLESDAIDEYAREHGTSGNQHNVARLLVIASAPPPGSEPGMAPKNVPAALTPLGVSPDYGPRA